MDTILLVVGVVGLSVSGWYLRGYFLNTPSVLTPSEISTESQSDQSASSQEVPMNYVTSEEHQGVLARIAELEKNGYSPKVEPDGQPNQPLQTTSVAAPQPGNLPGEQGLVAGTKSEEPEMSDAWKEIYALQQAYRLEREKENDIDYEREQTLFDMSQGYDGKRPSQATESDFQEEDHLDQRLQDNQLEDGEELDVYQERMNTFATLTKEMLIMRLDAADRQLREQQEKHQATLLNIIASLIERMPGDVNLKNVVQSSFVAASSEISNEEGEPNRNLFQEMFFQNVGH
ncbi:hypothetical protein [Spirosoma flavum]|uniref:Uncharacterized protein n=1 Tax=Spirosoma flavum TaxID=2048557 RepID=A0ABW6AL89_9BACT